MSQHHAFSILLANPRGFCAGVDRAIEIVERAIELFGTPVYVRHEVVHNTYVVDSLRKHGAIFVEELHEIPDNATVIFSAHGVSKTVREEATKRKLRVFDAICPLVTKVHMEVGKYQDEGKECILIGHAGHPEVEGTLGQYRSKNGKGGIYLVESTQDVGSLQVNNAEFLAYVTQTTLSVDDTHEIIACLKKRFPKIEGPRKEDICYATQNRQDAIKQLASKCDLILVVGSPNSSNSTRLKEIAQKVGPASFLINNHTEIKREWLENVDTVGISAGASAPEILVEQVVKQLVAWGASSVQVLEGKKENVVFSLPKDLSQEIRVQKTSANDSHQASSVLK